MSENDSNEEKQAQPPRVVFQTKTASTRYRCVIVGNGVVVEQSNKKDAMGFCVWTPSTEGTAADVLSLAVLELGAGASS